MLWHTNLTQSFSDGTWRESFLQASHEEPFVRRAIIAIAALSKAMEAFQPSLKSVKALPDIKDAFSQSESPMFRYIALAFNNFSCQDNFEGLEDRLIDLS